MSDKSWIKWRWDALRTLGTSKIVQLTFLIPVLGYFILFGEMFNDYLELTIDSGVSYWRVYFLYFGFCAVAAGSLLFSIKCPESVRQHGAAYEFVDREERTLSKYRIAKMQDLLVRRNYFMVARTENWPDYEVARDHVIANSDDHDENQAAASLVGIREKVEDLNDAALMTEYFVTLKSADPVSRLFVTCLYAVGIALIAVPTLVVFWQVVIAAWNASWAFLGSLGGP
jgi:hypothetical protein